jgi:phosphate uptake regulator
MNKGTILIIDDEKDLIEMVRYNLEDKEGFDTISATDGHSGVEIAQKMVRDALTAVVNRDVNIAERIIAEESKVDAFRDQVFRTLLTYMMADPGTIQRALSLILISRNIERIGDHATNIAEEAIYIVQGRDVRHAPELSAQLSS